MLTLSVLWHFWLGLQRHYVCKNTTLTMPKDSLVTYGFL